jgi:hypothetical protein
MFSFRISRPDAESLLKALERPKLARLRLRRFVRGPDHYHIDVGLGPTLVEATEIYIKALVREAVLRAWREPVQPFSEAVRQSYFDVVEKHHDAVIGEPVGSHRSERMQLFQLALLKFAHDRIDAELDALKQDLEEARGLQGAQLSGRNLELHRHAVILGQQYRHIRYTVSRHFMRALLRQEQSRFSKARETGLGEAWPLPEVMLANPLLQLGRVADATDFVRHFPIVLHDQEAARSCIRALFAVLADWLPDTVTGPPATIPAESLLPEKHGLYAAALIEIEPVVRGVFCREEASSARATWIDAPENAAALFGDAGEPRPRPWRAKSSEKLQRTLNRAFESALQDAGLLSSVQAAYMLTPMMSGLNNVAIGGLLFEYLRGDLRRGDMRRRLATLDSVDDPGVLLRKIELKQRELADDAGLEPRKLLSRFAADCLRYRRDLKLAWRTVSAMDSIRFVNDDGPRMLAMEKEQVQVFCRDGSESVARGNVIGHVIIRVDVRGASEMAEIMRQRSLHPAAYFSRHFYDPVARLLEQFGAEKVSVDGDTLVIALYEHASDKAQQATVARACCLAMAMMSVVDAMNQENERIGMPAIEVGLGIAYAEKAPTFLFDQEQKILVSPAVDRARRLSSCHGLLRRHCPLPSGRGLCVASPVDGGDDPEAALVRYNVFGIELDSGAFAQLHVELSLQRIRLRDRKSDRHDVLFTGSCTDVKGTEHRMLVREKRIRLLMGSRLLDADTDERRYYEVVTDPRLLRRIVERLQDDCHPGRLSASDAGPFARVTELN